MRRQDCNYCNYMNLILLLMIYKHASLFILLALHYRKLNQLENLPSWTCWNPIWDHFFEKKKKFFRNDHQTPCLQKLAPCTQQFRCLIRVYVFIGHAEKLGTYNNFRGPLGTTLGKLTCINYLSLVNSKSLVLFFLYRHVKDWRR